MKKICLLLLYVALSGQISAQTIKTYKGGMSESPVETIDFGYNLGLSLAPRIWSYQYYEDETGERVYHGKLTHSFQFAPNLFYTITGQYSHGKREGQWVWQVIGDNKKNYEKYVVNYHNGIREGDFSFQDNDGFYAYNMKGSFSNGQLFGTMTCTITGDLFGETFYYYEAHYSNGGYPDGTWKFDYNHNGIVENTEYHFLNNCLISWTTVDQSTGKRSFHKDERDWEKDDLYPYSIERKILIPESIAQKNTANNKGFRNGNTYYTFEEVNYDKDFDDPWIDFDDLDGFKKVHELYGRLRYNPKYLCIVWDEIRNKEVEDSIAEAERQQERQQEEQARLAELARQEEEKQRIYEAQQAHLRAVSQTQELADKIEIAYSTRKDAKKWKNVKGLFDIVSIHHDDYEDTPEDLSILNDYYIHVYRIFNSDIDNKSRTVFENLLEPDLEEAKDALGKPGGWRYYCEPDKIISNFVQRAKGLTLTDFDAIPDITAQEKLQYIKDSEKKAARAKKLSNFLNYMRSGH